MSCIHTHTVTLHGRCAAHEITLRPASDADVLLLCALNSDPEVLAFSDGDSTKPYTEQTVRDIWGSVSQNALCFIIEADGIPVGDCWLQRMNLPEVSARYPQRTDVRRIDMSIGRRECWNRGVGTAMVDMLMAYAFTQTTTDVLHCMCDASNIRSNRVWQKCGFRLAWQTPGDDPENHYALTQPEYFAKKSS